VSHESGVFFLRQQVDGSTDARHNFSALHRVEVEHFFVADAVLAGQFRTPFVAVLA
jgi:hypothetical protein